MAARAPQPKAKPKTSASAVLAPIVRKRGGKVQVVDLTPGAAKQGKPKYVTPKHVEQPKSPIPHGSFLGGVGHALGSVGTAALHYAEHHQQTALEKETGISPRKATGHALANSGKLGGTKGGKLAASTLGEYVASVIQKQHPEMGRSAAKELGKNFGNDLVDTATNAPAAVYVPSREVAQGHPKKAAKMLAQPYIDLAKHPLRQIIEHPALTALMVRGAAGGVDALAGRGVRGAGAVTGSETLKSIGSRDRPGATRTIPGTHVKVEKPYSKGLVGKAIQKQTDKLPHSDVIARVQRTPGQVSQRQIASEHNSATRAATQQAVNSVSKALRKAIGHHDKTSTLTNLVQQNIIAPSRHDAEAYLAELRAAEPRDAVTRAANQHTITQIQTELDRNPDFGKIADAAKAYREIVAPHTAKRYTEGVVSPDVERYAAQTPYAIRHMGADRATPDELNAHVSDLRKRRNELRKDLAAAVEHKGVAKGRAEILSRNVGDTRGENAAIRANADADAAAKGKAPFKSTSKNPLPRRHAGGGYGVLKAAEAEGKLRAELDSVTHGLKAAEAERDAGGYLRDEQGHPLTLDDILAHQKENGFDEAAFVTQRPQSTAIRGAKSSSGLGPQKPDLSQRRSGAAVREGTADFSGAALHEQALRHAIQAVGAERWRKDVEHVALRDPNGAVFERRTAAQARRDADNLGVLDPRVKWRVVPLDLAENLKAHPITHDDIEHYNTDTLLSDRMSQSISDALRGKSDSGRWGLIPDEIAKTWEAHARPLNTNAITSLSRNWRTNVLTFSPKWATGNVAEAALRAAVAGVGPGSVLTAARVRKELSPEARAEMDLHMTTGGHYFMSDRNNALARRRELSKVGEALHALAQKPGAKQAVQLYDLWTHSVYHAMGHFEKATQLAMAGKAMKESPLMDEHLLRSSKAAAKNIADHLEHGGKIDVNLMADFGRQVDDMYGKYSKFSPSVQRAVSLYTPFAAWFLNSVKFLYHTMPKDHPVITALVADATQATQDWRTKHGLTQHLFDVTGGAPDYLQGSIPGKGSTYLRAGRYLPTGIMDNTYGIAGSAGDLLLPQASGILKNLAGQDWKGSELGGAHQTVPQSRVLAAAGQSFLEGFVPAASAAEAVTGYQGPNVSAGAKKYPKSFVDRVRSWGDPTKYTQSAADSSSGGPKGWNSSGASGSKGWNVSGSGGGKAWNGG